MFLLLIRHGESVDNVAGLYAGSRDSPLTNHGVLQAKRLGSHVASRRDTIGPVKHIFTSNLQRAYRTAEAVADGQSLRPEHDSDAVEVIRLPELREKDFGSSEGLKYGRSSTPSGRVVHSDSETREAMTVRVDRFIDGHLLPLLDGHVSEKATVVIVAHGIVLSVLLTALTTRFQSVISAGAEGHSWSNTGVLQAKVGAIPQTSGILRTGNASTETKPGTKIGGPRYTFTIQLANNVDHLAGLKKTRGGIGSAQHDARQRTMTSFFAPTAKKRKATDEGTPRSHQH